MKIVLEQLVPIRYAAKTLFLFAYTDYKTICMPVVSITAKYLFRSSVKSLTVSLTGSVCMCVSTSTLRGTYRSWFDVDMASCLFWVFISRLSDLNFQDTFVAVQHI